MNTQLKWIKFYTAFLALFAMGAGLTAYLKPEAMFSMIDTQWEAVRLVTNGFAARNISIGILAILSLLMRNRYVYLAFFICRLSIDVQDLINAISADMEAINPWVAAASLGLLFILPLTLGILSILKEIKNR